MNDLLERPRASLFSATLARIGLLPWIRIRGGTVQITAPEWLYDLLALVFYPINWLIAAIAARAPAPYNRPDWPTDPDLAPDKLPPPTRDLAELSRIVRARDDTRLVDRDVWSLFDSLPAPTTSQVIGNWRGKVVYTGSWLGPAWLLERPCRALGIQWGKRYFSPYRGDPLIFILWGRIVYPMPLWGNVSLPEIAFRGKCGATMVYDHQPWKDHFRVLDDGRESGRRMLLGNWMSREKLGGWFTLEEAPELDRATADWLVRSPY